LILNLYLSIKNKVSLIFLFYEKYFPYNYLCPCKYDTKMKNLYFFNPDNEMAIANGNEYYTPPANILKMADDLAYLPTYFSEVGDYVLMQGIPERSFLERQERIFRRGVRPVTWEETVSLELNELRPWGWSPRMCRLFQTLRERTSTRFRQGEQVRWEVGREKWYSREMASVCLRKLREYLSLPCGIEGERCDTMSGLVERVRERASVVKAPWSSSGKGVLMLPRGAISAKEQEWVSGILQRQGFFMVEPKLNKVCDFAMEFYIDADSSVKFLGISLFYTSKQGWYQGNYVGCAERIERKLACYVEGTRLQRLKEGLVNVLAEMYRGVYTGYLGVDMMIYRDEDGQFQVQPCVEINLRYNMGILACALGERDLHPESEGIFRVHFFSRPREAWEHEKKMRENNPLVLETGKILSGYMALTPVAPTTRFIADLLVTSTRT